MARAIEAGLCGRCAWSRAVSGAASTFTMCTRGLTDPDYAKYPRLPVVACPGYAPQVTVAGERAEDQ